MFAGVFVVSTTTAVGGSAVSVVLFAEERDVVVFDTDE